MELYDRLKRRGQRRFGGGTWAVSESVQIDGVTCQEVWDLIRPPESAVSLTDETVRAYTEPGTEGGVGEVQVFVHVHDDVVEHEVKIVVVDEAPPFLARTRCLDPESPGVTSWELAQIDGAVELRMTFSLDTPAGQVLNPVFEEQWRDFTAKYLRRVRTALECAST